MNVETKEKQAAEKQAKETQERILSCFFARELFLLYVEEKLDSHRRLQIKNHNSKCPSCSLLLEKISFSKTMIKELSETRPTPALVEYVRKEQYFWTEFFDQAGWRNWPSTLQWAAQLSFVAGLLVVSIHYFPWLNFARRLHKIQKQTEIQQVAIVPGADDANTDSIESPQIKKPEAQSVVAEVPKASGAIAKTKTNQIPYGPPRPTEGLDDKTETKTETVVTAVAAPTSTVAVSDTEKTDPGSTAPKMAGFVWKGSLKVDKLSDEVASRVTQIVTTLGGVKAGQVELGWRRGDSRYYHFILPEENYDKLLSQLNSEGIVTLGKEPHPRVIKTGHMRIIMTVEESE